jgi:hypothetical protein
MTNLGYYAGMCLEGLRRKSIKTSVGRACSLAIILTLYLTKTKENHLAATFGTLRI